MFQQSLHMGKRVPRKAFPVRWKNGLVIMNPYGFCALLTEYCYISTDQTSRELVALKVLSECLAKGTVALSYIYEEYQVCTNYCIFNCVTLNCMFYMLQEMESVETAYTKLLLRPQPRIAAFVGENRCDYFVVCEQQVMCKVANLKTALFITFASYYCFNLEYPTPAKNVLYFFQDYILGHPDSSERSGSYLGVVSGIKRNINFHAVVLA